LKTTREELQSTIEEFESSSEELKAGNEETMSMNEELQSANEELETSKEELQSLNEELTTVNNQLQEKNDGLEALNNDIANLLNSTQIATLFLSADCRIKRFTPACSRLFQLLPSDVGRPLTDITHKFTDNELRADIDRVLCDLAPLEREVQTAQGEWFIRRVLTYRTLDNRIDGVVVTFTDVTLLKQAEIALRQNKELKRLATVLLDSNDAIILQDLEGRIVAWNHGAERLYGYSEAEALGLNISKLIPDPSRADELPFFEAIRRGETVPFWETRRTSRDGRVLDVSLTATLLRSEAGEPTAVSTTERDITEKKRTEVAFREIAAEEQRRIGQDLHDSAGQELTGLGLVAKTLADALRENKSPEVAMANKLVEGIQRVLSQIRIISRNLIPVEVDSQGLTAALTDLATRIDELDGVTCKFHQSQSIALDDHQSATQLYRIAQEAIANAIRHGHAGKITISLGQEEGRIILRIRDDGIGIQNQKSATDGLGLSSMRHRAGLINAKLTVDSAPAGGAPGGGTQAGGTLVTCIVGHPGGQS
jgi:two-component system CheB/CheR fusion protein